VEELVERVRAAVGQQPFMTTLGVEVAHAAAGEVDLELRFDERFTQQHGFLHAGAVAAVLDSACGYAAWAAAAGEVDVLTVEYKINLLEPAVGERVLCQGRVLRRGGRLTVCRGEAYADERLVATSTTTMAVRAR
jgi:uncharacterized protein (TIGR00369 family)